MVEAQKPRDCLVVQGGAPVSQGVPVDHVGHFGAVDEETVNVAAVSLP